MPIPTKFHTFVDGQVDAGKITAERLNENWDRLYRMFDPSSIGISEDNIASNSKILVSDRSYTGTQKITGRFEFQSMPIVPDSSIEESKINIVNIITKSTLDANLPSNVARTDRAQTISGSWTFTGGVSAGNVSLSGNLSVGGTLSLSQPVSNLIVETVSELPSTVVDGKFVFYNGELYIGKSGSWKKLVPSEEAFEFGIVLSSNIRTSNATQRSGSDSVYTLLKEIEFNEAVKGSLRVQYRHWVSVANETGYTYVAINDEIASSEFQATGTTPTVKQCDFTNLDLPAGSKIQIYGKVVNLVGEIVVDNFNLLYDRALISLCGVGVEPITLTNQTALNTTNNL